MRKIIQINDRLMFSVNDIAYLEKDTADFPVYIGPKLDLNFSTFDEFIHTFSSSKTDKLEEILTYENHWDVQEIDILRVSLITGVYFTFYHSQYVDSRLSDMRNLCNNLNNLANRLEKFYFGAPYMPQEYYDSITLFDNYIYYENGLVGDIVSNFKLYKE